METDPAAAAIERVVRGLVDRVTSVASHLTTVGS
jgi:hypothetical protein